MSTLFVGFSSKENMAVMGSDTSQLITTYDKNGNPVDTLAGSSQKVHVIGGRNLLGITGDTEFNQQIVNKIKSLIEPEEIFRVMFEMLNPQPARKRAHGFLLTVTKEGLFRRYEFSGAKLKENRPIEEYSTYEDDSLNIPFDYTLIEENTERDGYLSCNFLPGFRELNSVLIPMIKNYIPIATIAVTAIQLIGKLYPKIHNQKVVLWTIDRNGNIRKVKDDRNWFVTMLTKINNWHSFIKRNVKHNASGSFAAGTILATEFVGPVTGDVTGNSDTASGLAINTSVADANNAIALGTVYKIAPGASNNCPDSINTWFVVPIGETSILQRARNGVDFTIYERRLTGSTWGSWVKIINADGSAATATILNGLMMKTYLNTEGIFGGLAGDFNPVKFDTKVFDANNIYNTATGKCTPGVVGKYLVNVGIRGTSTFQSSEFFCPFIAINDKNNPICYPQDAKRDFLMTAIADLTSVNDFIWVGCSGYGGGDATVRRGKSISYFEVIQIG